MIPINNFLTAYLAVYVFSSAAEWIIDGINAINLKKYGQEVPEGFQGFIDADQLCRIEQYTIDKTNLSILESITGKTIFLFIILSGILPWLAESLKDVHFVLGGLVFFALPGLLGAAADLPFDYYHIFVIEERYGFNTRTLRLWLWDLLKSLVITLMLGTFLMSMLLIMVKYTGNTWWIWAWLIFFAFQLLMAVIYPTVIAPMFNKFTPIQDEELEKEIRSLSEREGISIKGIFQMDAARRSRHTNAYLSGLGRVKKIVLYDTLLDAHEKDEILAVLAHEIGHLKGNHIKKQLVMVGMVSLLLLYLASRMITWDTMYVSFGFSMMPAYAGLFLVAVLWEPIGFFLSPLAMAISRRFEREADRHTFRVLRNAEPLIMALKKMARDNLSNLRPHPLYVLFNYSHPPLLDRIKKLGGTS